MEGVRGGVCTTCLSQRRTVPLSGLAHVCAALLQNVVKLERDAPVCWECESLLRRCHRFRLNASRAQAALAGALRERRVNSEPLSTLTMHRKDYYDLIVYEDAEPLPIDASYTVDIGPDLVADESDSNCVVSTVEIDIKPITTNEADVSQLPLSERSIQNIPEITRIDSKPEGVNLKPIKPKAWLHIKSGGKTSRVPVFDESLTKNLQGIGSIVLPDPKENQPDSKEESLRQSKRKQLMRKGVRRKTASVEVNSGSKKMQKGKTLRILRVEGAATVASRKKFADTSRKNNIYFKTVQVSEEEMRAWRDDDARQPQYVNSPYKCVDCITGYYTERQLEDHRIYRHTRRADHSECQICWVQVRTEQLAAHRRDHYSVFECRECQLRYRVAKLMWSHVRFAHRTQPTQFPCAHCDAVFTSKPQRRYHVDTRHKCPERVKCEYCGKFYRGVLILKTHIKNTHGERSPVPCGVCGRTYLGEANMRAHARIAHRASPPPRRPHCAPCGVTFKNVETYKMHMRTSRSHVTPEQLKFKCDDCGSAFAVKRSLREHYESHHSFKTNSCQQCDKTYCSVRALRYHERRAHSGDERVRDKVCEHCGKTFYTGKGLRVHAVVHSEERPYVCVACGASFRFHSALYKHNQMKHRALAAPAATAVTPAPAGAEH